MVFPRYFFALCAVLLFAAVGGIPVEEQPESIKLSNADLEILSNYIAEDSEDVEERNPVRTNVSLSFHFNNPFTN